MGEILEAAALPVNLPYTILLITVAMYWVSVIVGVLDLGSLDIDVDTDVHADADVHAEGGMGSLGGILQFFNIGTVPFMVVMSFLVLFMWSGSLLGHHYWGSASWGVAGLMFPPLLVGGLFFAKFATTPLIKVFDAMEERVDVAVVGKTCLLQESADSEHISLAKVTGANGTVQLVNVKAYEGQHIEKGEQAIVVAFDPDAQCYRVSPIED